MQLVIGITDTSSRYLNYQRWMEESESSVQVIQLSSDKGDLEKCDGIIFTGGIDTHPMFYFSDRTDYPHAPPEFDPKRDAFELDTFENAIELGLPILAICRGMQLVNIALGGDLIQDIEEQGKKDHRRHGETDGMHGIAVVTGSLLHGIAGTESGTVNSAHHQAIGIVAPDLTISAWSPDGIAEGAEWNEKEGKPFLLCVQWHPERLALLQPDNPFTKNIRSKFLEAVKNNKR